MVVVTNVELGRGNTSPFVTRILLNTPPKPPPLFPPAAGVVVAVRTGGRSGAVAVMGGRFDTGMWLTTPPWAPPWLIDGGCGGGGGGGGGSEGTSVLVIGRCVESKMLLTTPPKASPWPDPPSAPVVGSGDCSGVLVVTGVPGGSGSTVFVSAGGTISSVLVVTGAGGVFEMIRQLAIPPNDPSAGSPQALLLSNPCGP